MWKYVALLVCLTCLPRFAAGQCASCPSPQTGDIKAVRYPLAGGASQVVGCYASGSDIEVNLDALGDWDTNDGEWVVQIYQCYSTPSPTLSIGSVTVAGVSSGLESLAIMVAGASSTWSEDRDDPISWPGCVNFGGLTIEEASVRAKTRVSIAVSGDITSGDPEEPAVIHANQIVRIQANGVTTGSGETATVTGGTIEALIIADGGDTYGANTTSIGHIRAWNAVKGSITALDKDIFTVRITGVANASRAPQGLLADVQAYAGHIFTLWSSGPIGPVEVMRMAQ